MTTENTAAPAPAPAAAAPAAAAPADTAAPAADTGSEVTYDDAFAEFNADSNAGMAPPPEPTPAPTTAPAPPPEPTPAPTAAPAPATGTEAPAPDIAALQAQIAALQAQVEAPPPTPAPTPAPEVPMYTTEETAALTKYQTDWSEVAAGEALVRRAEYRELVSFIFGQIGPQLEALSQSTKTVGSRSQYTAIKELVPEYDEVRAPTLEWVDKQPEYLKNAYLDIAAKGTPEDIADMIERFKKDTGWTKPAGAAAPAPAPAAPPAATPAPTAAPAAAALSAEAQAAVASLKPVSTGRTDIPQPADPNDFDAAFAEFANIK